MLTREGDQELRRRSSFRILLPVFLFFAIFAASVGVRIATDDVGTAAFVFQGSIGLLALWALYDGVARSLGRATFLGVGRGIDRLIGIVQAVGTLGLAFALLPNAVTLLNAIARLVIGPLR